MKCGDSGGLNSHGDPCNRSVQIGFTRCALHGGKSPSAIAKAEQMMAIARMPSIEALYTLIEQFSKNTCATCGYPDGTAEEKRMIVRTAQTILDRAGMGPKATLELTQQSDGPLFLELLTTEERVELLEALAQVRRIKENVRRRQIGELQNPPGTAILIEAQEPVQEAQIVTQDVPVEEPTPVEAPPSVEEPTPVEEVWVPKKTAAEILAEIMGS